MQRARRARVRASNQRRRRVAGGLAGGALAAAALLSTFAGSGVAAGLKKPDNTSRPSIEGTARVDQQLTAHHGEWTGDPGHFAYQWLRCGKGGGGCTRIDNGGGETYIVRSADVGHRLRVRVTAINGSGSAQATSAATGIVSQPAAQPPTTSEQPRVTGPAREGQVLTAAPNHWNGTQPIRLSYHWQRCNANGGSCEGTPIRTQTYLLRGTDVGHTLRVVVTATNRAGSASAVSDPSQMIQSAGGNPPSPPGTCMPVANVSLPNRLIIDRISYTPGLITSRDVPLVAHFHVSAVQGGCVSGALVYAVGVPFDRL